MKEKERYEVIYNEDELGYCIIDNEENLSDDMHSFNIIADLLNQQDKRIKELELRLETKETINNLYKATVSLRDGDFKDLVYENNKLKQENQQLAIENCELKKEKLYSDLLFTRLQYIHQQANECKEEKERFGVSENMAVDSIWRVFDLQKHECCGYEELSELENGIQSIAEDNLLRSIEHDLQFKPTRTEDEIFEEIQKINDQLKELKDNTK